MNMKLEVAMPDDKNERAAPFIVPISQSGSVNAPMLYFEEASAFGTIGGIVRVTLEATRIYPGTPGGGVSFERVVTAHLRMNISAARSLRAALDGALLLAASPRSETKN